MKKKTLQKILSLTECFIVLCVIEGQHGACSIKRYGNPNTEELPEWEEFDCTDRATMLFDNESRIAHNHDKELIDFIRTFPTRGF